MTRTILWDHRFGHGRGGLVKNPGISHAYEEVSDAWQMMCTPHWYLGSDVDLGPVPESPNLCPECLELSGVKW